MGGLGIITKNPRKCRRININYSEPQKRDPHINKKVYPIKLKKKHTLNGTSHYKHKDYKCRLLSVKNTKRCGLIVTRDGLTILVIKIS